MFSVEAEGQGNYSAPDGTNLEYRLSKWMSPIRVGLTGKNWEKYVPWVDAHLSDLGSLTGLEVTRVPPGQGKVGVVVIFSDDFLGDALGRYRGLFLRFFKDEATIEESVDDNKEPTYCSFLSGIKEGFPNQILLSVVMIPSNVGDNQIYECIVEELTQMLGAPNDADDIDPSIFNDNSSYADLTVSDRMTIRMLYDPRLKPGMTWLEAEPIAREILEELRPGG